MGYDGDPGLLDGEYRRGRLVNKTPQERLNAWTAFISGDLFGDPSKNMQRYAERPTWKRKPPSTDR